MKPIAIAEDKRLYPDLSEQEREKVRDFLDAYCRIALRIFERQEREELEGKPIGQEPVIIYEFSEDSL